MRKALRKSGVTPQPVGPQENKDSCDMRRLTVEEWEQYENRENGTFAWVTTVVEDNGVEYRCRSLAHVLPSGDQGSICIEPVPDQIKERIKHGNPPKAHTWTWDGNEDKPTLQPSVWLKGYWHGWFRNGRMESCR